VSDRDPFPLPGVIETDIIVRHLADVRRRARERRMDTPHCAVAVAMESIADQFDAVIQRAALSQRAFTTRQAAEYLGMDPRQVTYRFRTGQLRGEKKAGDLVFSVEALDEYRGARPRKTWTNPRAGGMPGTDK
jgi:hypothetical protein